MEPLERLQRSADIVWAVDREHRIVYWSRAAEQLLGYSSTEASGKRCSELLQARTPGGELICGEPCSVEEEVWGGGDGRDFVGRVRCQSGETIALNVKLLLLQEPSRTSPGVLLHVCRRWAEAETPVPVLDIRFLGPIVVRRHDGSVVDGSAWKRAKVRALLVVLALNRSRWIHRDQLLGLLWPNLERSRALHNLGSTIYSLRRSLEPALTKGAESAYVQWQGDCYRLLGGHAHWLDVEAFEDGVARARRSGDIGERIAVYQKVLCLYRGDYVADLDPDLVDCWVERERLRELYLNALTELAGLYVLQGDRQRADESFLQVLTVDPCRETAVRALMRSALDRGERTVALRHYLRLEKRLWRELRTRPSSETRRLYGELSLADRQP